MFLTKSSKEIKQIVTHLATLTGIAAQSKLDVEAIQASIERLDKIVEQLSRKPAVVVATRKKLRKVK